MKMSIMEDMETKLIENMTLAELDVERKLQLRRIESSSVALDEIHSRKTYQDEVAKHFVGGMVGFRTDRKKVNRSIDQYTKNASEACKHHDIIDEAKNRIHLVDKTVNFILENQPFGETERQIKECKRSAALESAQPLKWERVQGHYGVAYQHRSFIVERVDNGFVALRNSEGKLLSHYKTVKEAKTAVAIAISKVG